MEIYDSRQPGETHAEYLRRHRVEEIVFASMNRTKINLLCNQFGLQNWELLAT